MKASSSLSDLEQMDGKPSAGYLPTGAAPILINEYGWVWLNRDGSPTLLTETLYARLLGTNATPAERFAWNAYVLAGETEYWRAYRQCAGVLHFVYLTCSYPGVYTSDNFMDVEKLKLEPHFADYVGEAFKPLGVYVQVLPAHAESRLPSALLPSRSSTMKAKPPKVNWCFRSRLERGRELSHSATHFQLAALGDSTLRGAPGHSHRRREVPPESHRPIHRCQQEFSDY